MNRSISELRKFVSPEIVFGAGCRHRVGHFVSAFGANKVLIVSDPGVQAAGWVTDIEVSLQEQGIGYHVFTEVSPNPRVEEVMHGAEIYKMHECTAIVAVGGGSVALAGVVGTTGVFEVIAANVGAVVSVKAGILGSGTSTASLIKPAPKRTVSTTNSSITASDAPNALLGRRPKMMKKTIPINETQPR